MDLPWDGAAKLLSAGPLGLGAIIVLVTGSILLSKQPLPKEKFHLAISMVVAGGLLTLAGFFVLHEQITTTANQAGTALASEQSRAEKAEQGLTTAQTELSQKKTQLNEAIESNNRLRSSLSNAAGALETVKRSIDDASIAIGRDTLDIVTAQCPGGPHGTDCPHEPEVRNRIRQATADLTSATATVASSLSAIHSGP